ncbi:hypothetical protein TIFTF001_043780 [Ficus carica]|uniref:Uncharacterized protein n=1 Tax=Ficus carica TaxID=3494 RepID=A0AA87YVG1_FICCA|nr:hypothetical protein TIFTF001_043780 [Ficus carica]
MGSPMAIPASQRIPQPPQTFVAIKNSSSSCPSSSLLSHSTDGFFVEVGALGAVNRGG